MPVVPQLELEKYLDFKGMASYLKAVGQAAPHLVRIFSLGKSPEGRPLLVAEVTNRNLKEGREKPGIWIDGGHQGWNLLGTTACLELLRFLVSGHGRDEFLTDLVDHNVFYLAPRLAPDEMEICLTTGALAPQSSLKGVTKVAPRQFRVESELGQWKPFKRDARVMVGRNPEDRTGPFYDLYRQIDGERLVAALPHDFPGSAGHLGLQQPLELPSTRAIFEFLRTHSNVFGAISASGPGDLVRVFGSDDRGGLYSKLGVRLGELAGLRYQAKDQSDEGTFLNWTSNGLGLFSVDCKLWSLPAAAGLSLSEDADPLKVQETELLQILRFCENEFPDAFAEWKEDVDPQLGRGESGGWNWSQTWLNPPPGPYLSRELKKFSRLALGLASAGPRLVISKVEETHLGWGDAAESQDLPLRQLKVVIENRGFLPTFPLERAQARRAVLRVAGTDSKTELLIGETVTHLQEFNGFGNSFPEDGFPRGGSVSDDGILQRTVEREFLVRGSADVEVQVSHPCAGSDRKLSSSTHDKRPSAVSGSFEASSSKAPEENFPDAGFDDAFPSFEELYTEAPPAPSQETRKAPPMPAVSLEDDLDLQLERSREGIKPAPRPELDKPLSKSTSTASKLSFPSLDSPTAPEQKRSQSPFPAAQSPKGRVFGTPPQKPTTGLPGGGLGSGIKPSLPEKPKPSKSTAPEGEFSPLPLVSASESAFEPILPTEIKKTKAFDGVETFGVRQDVPDLPEIPPPPPVDSPPSAPPARLSRISAPQLLRRQRGNRGPSEPFKR